MVQQQNATHLKHVNELLTILVLVSHVNFHYMRQVGKKRFEASDVH